MTAISNKAPFYSPKIPAIQYKEFQTLLDKVQSVKEKYLTLIGCSYVWNKITEKWTPVVIVQITEEDDSKEGRITPSFDPRFFRMYYIEGTKLSVLGYASTEFRKEEETYPRVYLENIENKKKDTFKYVGYLLIKTIQQIFRDKCAGRMYLSFSYRAKKFYEKLGFVSCDESLKIPHMQTTSEACIQWLKEIAKNPISLPQRSVCCIL